VPNIGLPEIAMVLVIALIVFGPKRLPDMGRQLGKTIREFRDATSDIRSQIGIDDITDSVKDIKSGFSLTSTDGAASAAAVAASNAAGAPDATVDTPQIDAASAPAATRSSNRPVAAGAPPVAPEVRNGPVAASAPAPGPSPLDAPSPVTAPSAVDAPSAVADDAEGGVEAFGKLTRRSASSVRPAAD
jgi:TatA/E family protein of Tat protein translocase